MKKNRHEKIFELIENYDIDTQEKLAEMLRAEGYDVTQATVSRDIRQLKLTKVATAEGSQKYVVSAQDVDVLKEKYINVLRAGFVSMDNAQNILVMKTVSGMAMAVAAAIDALKFKEVLGCIAGDDTIMAAVRTTEDTIVVMDRIREMLGE
ncbi:MAG: arginine repressor [Butyrivibrio sp.]|jgi:transcriptional regulator of arginine metabolism|nr:arginine repressor [Butyrivibrio sp.]MBQ7430166.1 arginine repressor [Butyrivibrio sp.]MCR4833501.1 arginine repressor [Butyrivibrio sp.]